MFQARSALNATRVVASRSPHSKSNSAARSVRKVVVCAVEVRAGYFDLGAQGLEHLDRRLEHGEDLALHGYPAAEGGRPGHPKTAEVAQAGRAAKMAGSSESDSGSRGAGPRSPTASAPRRQRSGPSAPPPPAERIRALRPGRAPGRASDADRRRCRTTPGCAASRPCRCRRRAAAAPRPAPRPPRRCFRPPSGSGRTGCGWCRTPGCRCANRRRIPGRWSCRHESRRRLEPPNDLVVVGRDAVGKSGEPYVVRMPAVSWVSLNEMGRPGRRPERPPAAAPVGVAAAASRPFQVQTDDRVHRGVDPLDLLDVVGEQLTGGELAATQASSQLPGTQRGQRLRHCGTPADLACETVTAAV